MGKNSKVSSSAEWRLGENVVLRPMECLTLTVKFAIFITISHLFVSRPTIIGNKQLKKMEHGNFQQRTSSKKAV